MSGKLNKKTAPAQDTRVDLGYGTLNPKFQLSRSSNASFPYVDPDEYQLDDVDVDQASIDAVNIKNPSVKPTDFLDINKTDNFYYVGSATKLSERNAASSINSRSTQIGSKIGWSKPPPPSEENYEENTNLERLRLIISNIHSEEQEAGR